MTTSRINQGYEDGFNGKESINPHNKNYASGYRIGQADAKQRKAHLKDSTSFDMKDWLNDKADARNESGQY